jgi:hypothetical protein
MTGGFFSIDCEGSWFVEFHLFEERLKKRRSG